MFTSVRNRISQRSGALIFSAILRFERLVARYSLVGDEPFLSDERFPWTAELEAGWEAIRAELDAILEYREELPSFQDISPQQAALTTDDRWKTYFFYGYGFKFDANCCRCSETTRLVESVPGMKTAFFSILSPGKRIPTHRGPYKGVVRYHLGLRIPTPATSCGIKVDGRLAHWQEGKGMLFDDTYPHEAWNDSDDLRVVLFMDVLRPLPAPMAQANRLVLAAIAKTPFVRTAKENHRRWEERFEALRTARALT